MSAHSGTAARFSYRHYVTKPQGMKPQPPHLSDRGPYSDPSREPPMKLGVLGPQRSPYQMFMFRLRGEQIISVPLTTFRALPPFYYVSKHLIAGKSTLMTGHRVSLASPYLLFLFALLLKPARSRAIFSVFHLKSENWKEKGRG